MAIPKLLLAQAARPDAPSTGPALLEVRTGLVAIIGNSGSGKSTLLRMLESALRRRRRASGGDLAPGWYVGDALLDGPPQPLVVTPQENQLVYPTLTARDNVLHFLKALPWDQGRCPRILEAAAGGRVERLEDRADAALAAVGLDGAGHQPAGALSGGQKRRLLLAMDLALGPEVLVADEPLSQLDSSSASQVFDVLAAYAAERSVLFTVHQPIDEWVARCDQVWTVDAPNHVVSAVPGRAFVRAGRRLQAAGEAAAAGDQPAAYVVLKRLAEERAGRSALDRPLTEVLRADEPDATTPDDPALDEEDHPTLLDPPAEARAPRPGPDRLARFTHLVGHEVRSQFLGNLQSPAYLLMLGLFVGVTLFTNFVGAANQLPFSVPLASNALLVSVLFISTVSGVRIWSGVGADRIRQAALRGLDVAPILVSKATPALLEALLIATLATLGATLLELRAGAGAEGWPDTFSEVPWLPGIPTVAALMLYVGFVGWVQGMVISVLMAVRKQQGAVDHQRDPARSLKPARKGRPRLVDPVSQAYSLAVLLVVGQIGLGGAFGRITGPFREALDAAPGALATSAFDALGSLSPLRWGYNATLVSEWRQARCRVHAAMDVDCERDRLALKFPQECVEGGVQTDQFKPSEVKWAALGADTCGEEAGASNGAKARGVQDAVALYFQAGGAKADRLSRIKAKRDLLAERESSFPAEAISQSFSNESWSELNRVRLEGGEGEAVTCAKRRANVKYEQVLAEDLVGKGMIRPELVDVEWCWRSCPDVRESAEARGTYMLGACPLPGERDPLSGEAMKSLNVPLVAQLAGDRAYPCTNLAHGFFRDAERLPRRLFEVCGDREVLAAESDLLFWMTVVALFWGGLALYLTLSWSRRLQHGG